MAAKTSPFAPETYPELPAVAGVRLATAEAGIRYRGRRDVLLAEFAPGTSVAGVFTKSRCASAPVEWDRVRLLGGQARALVVNSGNANAFTGLKGREAVEVTAQAAADAVGCRADEVFLASTGVIGEPLDPEPFRRHLSSMARIAEPGAWADAARCIMTTDTFPKLATRRIEVGEQTLLINGIAKGSGMIAPDMATMLAFVFTDAAIAAPALQKALAAAVEPSFNAVTVDGDTSTSDTVLAFATGQGIAIEAGSEAEAAFSAALADLCLDLAHQVVRDGEGVTKFVEVTVTGAMSDASARKIAGSIANSPLVKTALAGEDANWGRVVMAVGKAGEPADRDRLAIWFGDFRVAAEGARDPSYSEAAVSEYMKQPELRIVADLGLGDGRATMWTGDLTAEYIAINADYRS